VLDAVDKVQTRIEELRQAKEDRRQLKLKFDDGSVESPAEGGFSGLPASQATILPPVYGRFCGKLLKANVGEVAERLKAAVC